MAGNRNSRQLSCINFTRSKQFSAFFPKARLEFLRAAASGAIDPAFELGGNFALDRTLFLDRMVFGVKRRMGG